MTFARSIVHQVRAHELIPGGAHTYAKGDDQFPQGMCPVIARGEGCLVWDLDGNEFIEYGAGARSVTLGHGYRPVVEAAMRAMELGANFARPHEIELRAAEAFLAAVPTAEMVKFAKNGSDATTAAIKLARAVTGREMIALCAGQPFYSVDDWFIATTDMPAGIPCCVGELNLSFPFNDLPAVRRLFEDNPRQIACVFLEPEREEPPDVGYLQSLADLCREHGALLIFDETISGFRHALGGAQAAHGVTPDLSTFGKAMANGFAVSALAGRREHMELGGLRQTDRERCFLMSTTHGAETHALAAMIETLTSIERENLIPRLAAGGRRLRDGFNAVARGLGIDEFLYAEGHPSVLIFTTKDEGGKRSQPFRTLFLQEMMKGGVLAPNLVLNLAHSEGVIDRTLEAISTAAEAYRRALSEGVDKYLVGRPVAPVFRRCNFG